MASNSQDTVLTLDKDANDSFSGFSSVDESETERTSQKPKTTKRKLSARNKKVKETKDTPKEKVVRNKGKGKGKDTQNDTCSATNNLNLNNLSRGDIDNLRTLLGIQSPSMNKENIENAELQELFGSSNVSQLPRMRVEIDSADISGGESPLHDNFNHDVNNDLRSALFEEGEISDDTEWDLPRLKAPLKGKPVSKSLANMINLACTSQCETDDIVSKYNVPENCDKMCAPHVNSEIWKVMDKRSQTQDRSMAEIQNLVASGMTPLVHLADILKSQLSSNTEAKKLLGDALTVMGQVQYNLSVRRRYMIRPVLKKKYHSICNISMPISAQLFGDDISKDIKTCDSLVAIGKEPYYNRGGFGRGRGNGRFPRRGNNYNDAYNQRYQPYSNRGQSRGNRGYRIPKKQPPATATSPNE